MKLSLIRFVVFGLALIVCADNRLFAQDAYKYVFEKIVTYEGDSTYKDPVLTKVDKHGGTATFKIDYTSKLSESYSFTWSFPKGALDVLDPEEKIPIKVEAKLLSEPTFSRSATISIGTIDGVLIPKESSKHFSGGHHNIQGRLHDPYPLPIAAEGREGTQRSNTVEGELTVPAHQHLAVKATTHKNNKLEPARTGILISLVANSPLPGRDNSVNFSILYVFKLVSADEVATAGPLNCPAVFRLGIQLGMLNISTERGDNIDFSLKILGFAIDAADGSGGCVTSDRLKELKSRMEKSKDSRAFYDEVVRIQAAYVEEVDANCQCLVKRETGPLVPQPDPQVP